MSNFLLPTRVRVWVDDVDAKYGSVIQLAIGTVVLALAIATVVLAFEIRATSDTTNEIARENAVRTKHTVEDQRQACLRVRRFAPTLANAYELHHFLSSEEADAYRDTIPPAPC